MEYVSGNIFIRVMPFAKAGDVVDGHAHNFDHTTYCPKGALRVEKIVVDGRVYDSTEIRASDEFNWALIEAGVIHRITALEGDSIGHCIYAHRNPQGDVVEQYEGWMKSYE